MKVEAYCSRCGNGLSISPLAEHRASKMPAIIPCRICLRHERQDAYAAGKMYIIQQEQENDPQAHD